MGSLVAALWCAGLLPAANLTRHYDFEEGTAGGSTTSVPDVFTDLLTVGSNGAAGLYWLEVPGTAPRPLPPGTLQESVASVALVAPALDAAIGQATYTDVSDGSAADSPAIGSQLALSFNGDAAFDDFNTAPGSRGVYVDMAAYDNNEVVAGGTNVFESFSILSQAWVRPSATGLGFLQTVYQVGNEQGSVDITADGFWQASRLGSPGDFVTTIPVAFDEWTHVAIFRGGNGAEFYINGQLVAGNRNPDPPNWFNTFASIINLGAGEFGVEPYFGLIDDFKIMGTADTSVNAMNDLDYFKSLVTCDFDSDGQCDIDDLNALLAEGPIAAGVAVVPGQNSMFDLDGNGTIDLADLQEWLSLAATENGLGSPYKLGDANLDGSVDVSDFNNWNSGKFTNTLAWDAGDFNGDGAVDVSDFNLWNANKFTASANVSAVPEPTAILPLLVVWLIWSGRRADRRHG